MFVTACSSIAPTANTIYGKWRLVHSNQSEAVGTSESKEEIDIEFRPDGSAVLTQDGKTFLHRYQYSGGSRLQLTTTGGPLNKTVEFQGMSRMRLIQGRQGVAFLTPIVDEYERISR